MKKNILRVLAVIPGLPMLMNGLGFLTDPEQAAAGLGMDLLDGIGRSTQVGDFMSFFIGVAVLIFIGAFKARGQLLYVAAMFIGGAAVGRIIAATAHGAEMASQFIIAETVLTLWLCLCAYFLNKTTD